MKQITGTCYFCKKDVDKHTVRELRLHLIMNHGYIMKLRQVQHHLIKDKKILKKHLAKKAIQIVKAKLRYSF